MSIETLKLELINWILQLDDETLLIRLNSLKRKPKDNWDSLSYEDRQAIEEGLSQVKEGNTIDYIDVRKEIEELLNLDS